MSLFVTTQQCSSRQHASLLIYYLKTGLIIVLWSHGLRITIVYKYWKPPEEQQVLFQKNSGWKRMGRVEIHFSESFILKSVVVVLETI